jgi:hypothetical protein
VGSGRFFFCFFGQKNGNLCLPLNLKKWVSKFHPTVVNGGRI